MRYARVPTGRETCGYCYMLASNGWYYKTAQAAGAGSHDGCDCMVMAGGVGTELPYDPKWLKSCWHDCIDTVGNESLEARARARWAEMTQAEREKFRAKIKHETAEFLETLTDEERARFGLSSKQLDEGAFKRFYADVLRKESWREVERRDVGWLYRKVEPPVDYSANPRSAYGTLRHMSEVFNPADYDVENFEGKRGDEWRDLFAHDALKHHGFRVTARPADAPDGYTNIDLMIDGELWEVKSPYTTRGANPSSLRFVEKRLEEASLQFESQFDAAEGMAATYSGSKRIVLNMRYRLLQTSRDKFIGKIRHEKKANDIDEVLVIYADGTIERII